MNELSTRYLDRLSVALADAPADLRDEIVSGVRESLAGLGPDETATRIAELGDPALIAAEALDAPPLDAPPPAAATAPVQPVPQPRSSSLYVAITVALLVIGGYLLPVVGWLAAILLIVGSTAWTSREKKVAIATSVGAGFVALVALFTLRGAQTGDLGFVLFLSLPLIVNLAVGFYLGLKSRTAVAGQRV